MSNIDLFFDTAMCFLWITTYTLVFIGTIKYKYPLISPITQAIVAPLEFSVFTLIIVTSSTFNYAVVAYAYWSIIEVAIFAIMIKIGFIKRKHIIPYIIVALFIFAIMIFMVAIRRQVLLATYLDTFIGMAFWFGFILKKDYPIKAFTIAVFISKFLADIFAAIVYFGDGSYWINILSVLLPVLDFMFVAVYIIRKSVELPTCQKSKS